MSGLAIPILKFGFEQLKEPLLKALGFKPTNPAQESADIRRGLKAIKDRLKGVEAIVTTESLLEPAREAHTAIWNTLDKLNEYEQSGEVNLADELLVQDGEKIASLLVNMDLGLIDSELGGLFAAIWDHYMAKLEDATNLDFGVKDMQDSMQKWPGLFEVIEITGAIIVLAYHQRRPADGEEFDRQNLLDSALEKSKGRREGWREVLSKKKADRKAYDFLVDEYERQTANPPQPPTRFRLQNYNRETVAFRRDLNLGKANEYIRTCTYREGDPTMEWTLRFLPNGRWQLWSIRSGEEAVYAGNHDQAMKPAAASIVRVAKGVDPTGRAYGPWAGIGPATPGSRNFDEAKTKAKIIPQRQVDDSLCIAVLLPGMTGDDLQKFPYWFITKNTLNVPANHHDEVSSWVAEHQRSMKFGVKNDTKSLIFVPLYTDEVANASKTHPGRIGNSWRGEPFAFPYPCFPGETVHFGAGGMVSVEAKFGFSVWSTQKRPESQSFEEYYDTVREDFTGQIRLGRGETKAELVGHVVLAVVVPFIGDNGMSVIDYGPKASWSMKEEGGWKGERWVEEGSWKEGLMESVGFSTKYWIGGGTDSVYAEVAFTDATPGATVLPQ